MSKSLIRLIAKIVIYNEFDAALTQSDHGSIVLNNVLKIC